MAAHAATLPTGSAGDTLLDAMRFSAAPHRWDVSPRRAAAIQRELAGRVRFRRPPGRIRVVGGVDAAFSRDDRECLAAAVLWDRESGDVLETSVAHAPLRFPYVPGLLSFREAPAVLAALRRLRGAPDALICDGQGYAHPRRFGLACHVGVIAGLPTVGCAKSRLLGEHGDPAAKRGGRTPLIHAGERVGTVLRTRDGVRPLYVSVGHEIDLRSAETLVLACAVRYRLPEPTRLADRLVAAEKRRTG
jgi:deoxyribonuclease V